MTEQPSFPTNWVSKADLIRCYPDQKERLERLDDSEVECIAGEIGDALQETYWLVMEIILADYLKTDPD